METNTFIETLVLGGGPAGIQTGYFLEKLNKEYLVLERNSIPGSFFGSYPLSRKLISLNKKNTGFSNPEVNLRYDWNSLLNDENFVFSEYSDELYPNAEALLRYLSDFVARMNIKVRYNSNVIKVEKVEKVNRNRDDFEIYNDDVYYIIRLDDVVYTCKYLIIANGVKHKKTKFKNYSDFHNIDVESFNDKRVCIVGSGNSAFELADMLIEKVRYAIVFQKKVDLSMLSHYPGGVRGNHLHLLDLFSLKVLTAVFEVNPIMIEDNFVYEDGVYKVIDRAPPFMKYPFDELIFCTGFEFDGSIFDFNVAKNGKYPHVNSNYESINNKNLFFAGTIMHSLDRKISAGGFIHGFRYLVRFMIDSLHNKHEKLNFNKVNDLALHIFERINMASSLYLMYNFMCDIVYFENERIVFIRDQTMESIKDIKVPVMVISLNNRKSEEFSEFMTAVGNHSRNPKFLHPVISFRNLGDQKDIIFHEDILALFDDEKYYNKISETIKLFITRCKSGRFTPWSLST